jgi:SAM-dependent methyltransferase
MSLLGSIHGQCVFPRRVRVLARHFAELLPQNARVLDIGCGDGSISRRIMEQRPDLQMEGLDVLVRRESKIPVTQFDGRNISHADRSFDATLLVDVLHHAGEPLALLREAARVSRQAVFIKDHLLEGYCARVTLRFMDWVGNAHHGVALPYNYWRESKWREACVQLGLKPAVWRTALGLYSWPTNIFFERSLHFIGRLDVSNGNSGAVAK